MNRRVYVYLSHLLVKKSPFDKTKLPVTSIIESNVQFRSLDLEFILIPHPSDCRTWPTRKAPDLERRAVQNASAAPMLHVPHNRRKDLTTIRRYL